jgi:peroxiredoxin
MIEAAHRVRRRVTWPDSAYRGPMPLKPGDKAPSFTLLDQAGSKVKLSDFKGRKVLVYFYPSA